MAAPLPRPLPRPLPGPMDDRATPATAFDALRHPGAPVAPPPSEVHALVERARTHAFGLDFLLHGAPNAVAATFGVHAFLVDAARDHVARTSAPRA